MREKIIEAATKAFHEALIDDPDSLCWMDADHYDPKDCVIDGYVNLERAMNRGFDAALKVMMEPDEAMRENGMRCFMAHHDPMFIKNEPAGPIFKAMLSTLTQVGDER